ncbi:MAG: UPF0179 family protein [Candidatus Heimdallarchaeota archaeon]|nr:UPF0179 family protein [Candidatus Heimdallarchaeota archaeon]
MTEDKLLKVTLLGVKQSVKGNKFIFMGETEECPSCRLQGACLKLEKNRVYEVASVRDTIHSCAVFEEGVRTVEIFEPMYIISTGAKLAVESAIFTFTPRECDLMDCPHFNHHCLPPYLKEGEKFKIIQVFDTQVECQQGYKLKLVEAERTNNNNI